MGIRSNGNTEQQNPELAKLYFMGFSTKEKRESGLQEYILK